MVTRVKDTVGPTTFSDPFAQDLGTTTGLTFGFVGGDVLVGGVTTTIADGTVALSDASTNIVYIDLTATPSIKKATIAAKPNQDESIFLFIVTTASGVQTSTLDLRTWVTSSTAV